MEFFGYFIIAFELYLIFTVIVLLLDNRSPAETFAWIFIFILMPGLGFIIYFLTGHNWKRSYDYQRKLPQYAAKNLVALFKPIDDLQEEIIKLSKNKSPGYQDDMMTLLYRNSRAFVTIDNKIEIFHNGQDKFDRLFEDLRNAKHYIHMEYFIWMSNDPLGEEVKDILIKKAREGVEIRLLYDYSGCLFRLSCAYLNELRKEKILIYPFFNYLSGFKFHTLNYRNHRKIVVIDGKIGYTGGMNIGQEYIDGGKRFKFWRDTHMRIEGDAVSPLCAIFGIDWYNTTAQDDVFDAKYYPLISNKKSLSGNLPIQLPTSGFDSPWPSILQLYFLFITMAQKEITIVSPYFVPDSSLLVALKTAGMRGIKVTVLMTGVPDNPIPYWAAFSYFEELLKAGVKIFQYQKGFMHAKMFSSDGKICSIGTANFDMRSLKLNYEINAVIYDEETTKQVDKQILEDLKECKEMTLADLNHISIPIKLRNSVARLVSPIL